MDGVNNHNDGSNMVHDLTTVSLDALYHELRRRNENQDSIKPSCGTTNKQGEYNTPIHIFALFLILIISTLACSFPIIARRFPSLPIPHRFLFLSRHFGTGVLIATAFIHLLPTAFISMTDPCLPAFWNETYPPMPGAVAMLAVLTVVAVEQFFAIRGARHSHGGDLNEILPRSRTDHHRTRNRRYSSAATHRQRGHLPLHVVSSPMIDTPTMDANEEGFGSPPTPRPRSPDSHFHEQDRDEERNFDDLDDLDPMTAQATYLSDPRRSHSHKHTRESSAGQDSSCQTYDGAEQDPQKLFLQCLLLEAGILFHSVFIGMAVSVATGTEFVVLLIAICFHQTFEGFALGARIAALIPTLFDASSPRPWLMALAYGATTPIGQALGLVLHNLYDPASEVGLLTVGVTNAVSSGLLLFAGLVQLVAEDFLSDRSYVILRGRNRFEANMAVAAGGVLMAIVGAFA